MARPKNIKTNMQADHAKPNHAKTILIGVYGLVVLGALGVMGGYLVLGNPDRQVARTTSLNTPGPAEPRTEPSVEPRDEPRVVPAAAEITPVKYDWDLGEGELNNILTSPSLDVHSSSVLAPKPVALVIPDVTVMITPTWRQYAVAPPPIDGRPVIAIIIDDVGESQAMVDRLLALDAPLTLSFFAWVPNIKKKAAQAWEAGFELMVHVPMEPILPKDPGPKAILDGLELAENQRRLAWHLDQFHGYVGFNNHMGSLVTANSKLMSMVMKEAGDRDMLFVDSLTSPKSVAGSMARQAGLPTADRDVFLDHEDSREAIDRQLEKLEQKALKHGRAVAIGHPRAATIERLEAWIPEARARGFVIVPVSAIISASMG